MKNITMFPAGKASGDRCTETEIRLPSGCRVAVLVRCEGERVRIRTPSGGGMEVYFDRDGRPVVKMDGADLVVEEVDLFAVKCRRMDLEARESVRVQSGGGMEIGARDEAAIRSDKDLRCHGERILLNCEEM